MGLREKQLTERRERILQAARKLIRRTGGTAFSMRVLADEAEVVGVAVGEPPGLRHRHGLRGLAGPDRSDPLVLRGRLDRRRRPGHLDRPKAGRRDVLVGERLARVLRQPGVELPGQDWHPARLRGRRSLAPRQPHAQQRAREVELEVAGRRDRAAEQHGVHRQGAGLGR